MAHRQHNTLETPSVEASLLIDAHHHLWRYTPEEYAWISPQMSVLQRDFLPQDLRQEKAVSGIHGSVVVQARQTIEETTWLLECAAGDPSIFGVVGWLPLADPNLPTFLRQFSDRPHLKALRHVIQDEDNDNFILHKDFNQGIASLLDTGLAYDILIHERHLPQTVTFLQNHPNQIFILDHLAKPRIREGMLEPWKSNFARLAEFPNVFCKVSGLVTEADCTTWILDDLRPYLDAALQILWPYPPHGRFRLAGLPARQRLSTMVVSPVEMGRGLHPPEPRKFTGWHRRQDLRSLNERFDPPSGVEQGSPGYGNQVDACKSRD
jgi:L-fuconolactonase